MTITRKIYILFATSLILMSIIGFWIDSINSQRINALVKDKYVKITNELLQNLDNNDQINKVTLKHKLKILEKPRTKEKEVLYYKDLTFGFATIFKESFEDEFIIHIKYLDEEYILKSQDEENLNEKLKLNFLISLDILVLIIIFLYILKLISPLKMITKRLDTFARGDLSSRIIVKSNDEIGILSESFNQMASSLETLIKTREELLRDISHELRTPIAKGKFAIEKIDNFSQKELLKKIFIDLELLTNELIELEKLNSSKLTIDSFSIETLIVESLDKLYIKDEEKIIVKISEEFMISADINYLSIAVKNLLDNALKYSTSYPIIIKSSKNCLYIMNNGNKLSKDLDYYLKPFTQELSQRDGFGLGLSIVKKIIDKHLFSIKYSYKNGQNIFCIKFIKNSPK